MIRKIGGYTDILLPLVASTLFIITFSISLLISGKDGKNNQTISPTPTPVISQTVVITSSPSPSPTP